MILSSWQKVKKQFALQALTDLYWTNPNKWLNDQTEKKTTLKEAEIEVYLHVQRCPLTQNVK